MGAGEDFNDFYEILQLSQSAELETIQRVARMLLKRYHPDDPTTGDPEKFGLVYEAQRVLTSAQLRAKYDQTYAQRRAAAHGARGGPAPGAAPAAGLRAMTPPS